MGLASFCLLLYSVLDKESSTQVGTGVEPEPFLSPAVVISDNAVDRDKDGTNETLRVIMTKGKVIHDSDPGPFMGDRWEGNFAVELADAGGKRIGLTDLNEAFGESTLLFTRTFTIQFEDYNKDGSLDFTIGQYASSNGYVYKLFTIGTEGISALPLEGRSTLFNASSEYSVRFPKLEQPGFHSTYYDNSFGKNIVNNWLWENGLFHSYSSMEILIRAYESRQLAELSQKHISAAFMGSAAIKSLVIGDTQEQVRSLFGKPDYVRAVGFSDNPDVYTGWRYESANHQLDITWSELDAVMEYNLSYREGSGEGTVNFHASPFSLGQAAVSNVPLVPTRQQATEWKFDSMLRYNYLVGRAEETLLVLGHDGLYSGHHTDSILYGVAADTGQKLWEVPGKYAGAAYSLSSDHKHAAILTWLNPETMEYENKLQWIDVRKGNVVWEQKWTEQQQMVSRLISAKGAVVMEQRQDSSVGSAASLRALKESTGELLWEKNLSADERPLYDSSGPFIVVVGTHSIQAYEPLNGQVVWSRQDTVRDWTIHDDVRRYLELSNSDNRSFMKQSPSRYWILLENGYTCLDLTSGATIAVLPYEKGNYYKVVSDDYMFIYKSDSPEYWKGTTFTTSLYDLKRNTTLWQTAGRGRYSNVEDDTLYYLLDDHPIAVELTSGNPLWQSPYAVRELERNIPNYEFGDKQPVVVNDELWVPGKEQIFVFDRHSGALINRIGNLVLGSAAMQLFHTDYGLLNELHDGIYVGSANGTFSKIK